MNITLQPMQPSDWTQVRAIYLEGIATGNATFAQSAPEWERWNSDHLPAPRLVARHGDDILGWAALSPVSSRRVYAGVAEISIYVAERDRGRGVGLQLMARLITDSESAGIWTLQAGIFPENKASIALHERAGFRMVGIRHKLGKMEGRWRDVILMERRNAVVG